MTASTRFIGLAVLAWAGVRAISLGLVPGSEAWALDVPRPPTSSATPSSLPPVQATEFAPIEPVAAAGPAPLDAPAAMAAPVQPIAAPYPVYVPVPAYASRTAQSPGLVRFASAELPPPRPFTGAAPLTADLPPPRRIAYSGSSVTIDLPPARDASAAAPQAPVPVAPLFRRTNRLELSSWALLRGKRGDILGSNSLAASSGTLGGSQAGARINYWIRPNLAASLRTSAPLGGARGGEVAAGVRYQPFLNLPFSITAERRQRFGRAGGRNDFALFMEGGLWDRPMPLGFRLDAYAQAGVVGVSDRDLFADGAFTLTRPLWRNVSGGFGMWGGAQPHLYRIDAGPRLTVGMTKTMRVHLDYRQRLAGTASPSSGPAVTIAGDF